MILLLWLLLCYRSGSTDATSHWRWLLSWYLCSWMSEKLVPCRGGQWAQRS